MKKSWLKLNRIIKYLVYSDLVFYTGWGLISPVFAIFILNYIPGGSALVVGLAAAINLAFRSALRIPFGILADDSQKKSYYFMVIGLLVSALIPLGYIFARTPMHLYILQAVLGAALAISTAGWTGIFAKYMDKGKESTEWGVDAVAVGIGPAIAAAVGGLAVTYFSFNWVFVAVTIMGLIGVILLLFVKSDVLRANSRGSGRLFVQHELRRMKKANVAYSK